MKPNNEVEVGTREGGGQPESPKSENGKRRLPQIPVAENALLFAGNAGFLAAYYFWLPGKLQASFFPAWHLSIILLVESAFILAVIGVIYYLYSPEKPSQRVKGYVIINTVGVVFCLLISWQNIAFFDPAGQPLASVVEKNGVVSEVFFVDANTTHSSVTGATLRPICPADVPQARRLVTTGSDIVRWIPGIRSLIPPPPPLPPPPLFSDPIPFLIDGEEVNAGDHIWIISIIGKVGLPKFQNQEEASCLLKEGWRYKIELKTHEGRGVFGLIERGTATSTVLVKYRKERW